MDGFSGKKAFENFLKNNDIKKLNKTIFDYDLSDSKDPKYKEKLAICLMSLKSMKNYTMGNCLSQNHLTDKNRNHILGIRHLNQQHTYYYDGEHKAVYSGNSVSVFVSLLNHSCLPNVHSFSVDNKVAVVVLKPIKEGEQLFRSYW
jgi:SET domain-containing protein